MSFLGFFQRRIVEVAPWFLRRKNMGRFLEAIGLSYDTAADTLVQGLKLSQPLRCHPSALPILSKDRGIRIYEMEPEESQRTRLARRYQLHKRRGSHRGEMEYLQPYFLPGTLPRMRIVHQNGVGSSAAIATWHTLEPDGTYSAYRKGNPVGTGVYNWNFDGAATQWSRFWVIIYTPGTILDSVIRYDDGSEYDAPGVYYDAAILTQIATDIVQALLDWKAAHSTLWGVILATDPDSFDPTATAVTSPEGWTSLPLGNWGSPIDGMGNFTRLPTALWIYDLGQG